MIHALDIEHRADGNTIFDELDRQLGHLKHEANENESDMQFQGVECRKLLANLGLGAASVGQLFDA